MATFSKLKLSQSDGGTGIKIANTSTLIHTSVTGTSDWHELWLYAYNSSTDTQSLTIQYGGSAGTDYDITQLITAQSGLYLVVPGLILQDGKSVNGITPNTTDKVFIYGYVNSIDMSS